MNWTKYMAVLGVAVVAAQAGEQEVTVLKTKKDKTSYSIGVDMARNFKRQGLEIDLDMLVKGYRDADADARLLLPESERDDIRKAYMAAAMREQAMAKRTPGKENEVKGTAFLNANKTKKGVVCLPDGLQYEVLKAGTGKKPAETNTVECQYRGMKLDGTEFVSTSPGKPATFKVEAAIVPALARALPLMPVGSKWKLFVPPELAFGARGAGRAIGPNETVLFEVELAAIKEL